jgi:hypoxanthine phosphoribosyltransferase
MDEDISHVLIDEKTIQRRVTEMAREIASVYEDQEDGITIVPLMTGSIIFVADLVRQLPFKLRIGLVTVSSYVGRSTKSRGATLESSLPDLHDQNVMIVDDVLDTGVTLRLVQNQIRSTKPRDLKTAVLLRKPGAGPTPEPVDFVGFDIPNEFVVGYGLDFDGFYRNLPNIAILRPAVLSQSRAEPCKTH